MLKISIIIPVYKVQGFLRECLESILASRYPQLEVIGVNDCSPDQSGQILAEFAAADPRVRALRTPHNTGSGGARNLGLDAATGDYVWFVDSDDVIAPGAIERIVAKLSEYESTARPDVLVFDYKRLTETGKLLGSDLPGLLRDNEPPAAFSFASWPTIARYTHTTWNKVVRRDFLVGLGLRFHPGWYQDVPWTYPLLLAAEHIALIDTPGYHYRQRRAGSVTRTASDRHFEVLMQWRRVWDSVDELTAEPTRHAMFHRLIWHCMQVLGNDDRIMPQARRAFFDSVADLYDECDPGPGYRRPGGFEGMKQFLLQRRWFFGYLLTRSLRRGYNRLRWGHPYGRGFAQSRFSGFRSAAARVRELFATKGMAGFAGLYYYIQAGLSVKPDLVVLACDGHARPSGACAAIDARIGELYPHLTRVWLTTAPRDTDRSAAPGTAAFHRALARARYLVTDFEPDDHVVKRDGTTHVRVLSDTPIEAIGLDRLRLDGGDTDDVTRLYSRMDRWDFVVSPNRHTSEVVDRAFQIRAETLEYGMPGRGDRLDDARRERIRAALGVDTATRLVCYHPATRPPGMPEPDFDLVRIRRHLPGTTALLLRDGGVVTRADADGVFVSTALPDDVSVAEVYRAADIVIGDYRGSVIDRAVAGLPTLLYLPDWDGYAGRVTADLPRAGLGPVAHDWAMLVELLNRLSGKPKRLSGQPRRFADWRPGDAADAVARRIFGPVRHAMVARPEVTVANPPVSPVRFGEPGMSGPAVPAERAPSASGESTGVR